eukprot:TRINITY_DN4525_c0_g1_i1.p1 TRINITY_DN4525_c0_g1~~TRINITY_DN4525_c0_g1_i1.p1  ORF type:complete len:236 (+),score=32.07 TRINITY_DN4525_c0_g1_i1:135-842(+)
MNETKVRLMIQTEHSSFYALKKHPKSLTPRSSGKKVNIPPNAIRVTLRLPDDSTGFMIENFLTTTECQHYIATTEKTGYDSLAKQFKTDYRLSDRLLILDEPFAHALWQRAEQFFQQDDVFKIRPIGFSNDGIWRPIRFNECIKFNKYHAGGFFSPHVDGPWVPKADESSIYTMIVYLNSDFSGGETIFYNEKQEEISRVIPKLGTAIFFTHDTLHMGAAVKSGTKVPKKNRYIR